MLSCGWPSAWRPYSSRLLTTPSRLRADIDEDLVLVDPDDGALDDIAVLEALDVGVLLGEQLLHRRRLRAEFARATSSGSSSAAGASAVSSGPRASSSLESRRSLAMWPVRRLLRRGRPTRPVRRPRPVVRLGRSVGAAATTASASEVGSSRRAPRVHRGSRLRQGALGAATGCSGAGSVGGSDAAGASVAVVSAEGSSATGSSATAKVATDPLRRSGHVGGGLRVRRGPALLFFDQRSGHSCHGFAPTNQERPERSSGRRREWGVGPWYRLRGPLLRSRWVLRSLFSCPAS